DYIKYLKNQDQFNKWTMTDPNMKRDYKGTDGTVGFVYAWNGNDKAGQGEQEISQIKEGSEFDTEIRFERPMKSVAHIKMTTEPVSGNQTKVTWTMAGESKYPLNVMTLFLSGMLGKDMDESFAGLKTIMEK
ncbi:MAG: SRPBCC family protein, partial [Dyadobacter sp.]